MKKSLWITAGMIAVIIVAVGGGTALGRSVTTTPAKPEVVSPMQLTTVGNPVSVQGLLTDPAGQAVSDGDYNVTFRFYNAATAGDLLWEESKVIRTTNGMFSALLGETAPIDPAMFAGNPVTYLGIQMEGDPEMSPRIRNSYTPYAMHAISASETSQPKALVRDVSGIVNLLAVNMDHTAPFSCTFSQTGQHGFSYTVPVGKALLITDILVNQSNGALWTDGRGIIFDARPVFGSTVQTDGQVHLKTPLRVVAGEQLCPYAGTTSVSLFVSGQLVDAP